MTPSATYSSEIVEGSPPEASDDELLLRRRRRSKLGSAIEGLNLTAMMDVMTILLVYLIKQYASAPENIQLADDLKPPASITTDTLVPGVRVTMSRSAILVDDKLVLKLQDGRPVDGAAGDVNAWTPVGAALGTRRETIQRIADGGGAPFDGSLMVVADEDTPYDVLYGVLYVAGKEQFTSFRLITRRK